MSIEQFFAMGWNILAATIVIVFVGVFSCAAVYLAIERWRMSRRGYFRTRKR